MTPPRNPLSPIATFRSRPEWEAFANGPVLEERRAVDRAILAAHARDEVWSLEAWSYPAQALAPLRVDLLFGGVDDGGVCRPNLRERLACSASGLNNRQRLVASLVGQAIDGGDVRAVYFMECVTPTFQWARRRCEGVALVGSEYFGEGRRPGEIVDGVRHEDVCALSFDDAAFDLVVSNDVLEHVPDVGAALCEAARVLRRGGTMLMTVPFHANRDESVVRARIEGGALRHLLPPEFHGNPVSPDGSLVFTDFGWDLLDEARRHGFRDADVACYHSVAYGHLGDGLLVFRLTK